MNIFITHLAPALGIILLLFIRMWMYRKMSRQLESQMVAESESQTWKKSA
jgi:hypothetical protein